MNFTFDVFDALHGAKHESNARLDGGPYQVASPLASGSPKRKGQLDSQQNVISKIVRLVDIVSREQRL